MISLGSLCIKFTCFTSLFTPGIFEELDPELLLDLSLLAPVRKVAGFPWHV